MYEIHNVAGNATRHVERWRRGGVNKNGRDGVNFSEQLQNSASGPSGHVSTYCSSFQLQFFLFTNNMQ